MARTLIQQINDMFKEQLRSPHAASDVTDAATRLFNVPRKLNLLAVEAFCKQWPESWKTRAIRKGIGLLEKDGITDDEPGVEET